MDTSGIPVIVMNTIKKKKPSWITVTPRNETVEQPIVNLISDYYRPSIYNRKEPLKTNSLKNIPIEHTNEYSFYI